MVSVAVTLCVVTVSSAVAVVWWAAQLDNRVERLEKSHDFTVQRVIELMTEKGKKPTGE